MKATHAPPIVLVNHDSRELDFLAGQLVEAGVPNPLLAFDSGEGAIDYLQAVCAASSRDSRFMPCLLLVDLGLRGAINSAKVIAWVRKQPSLARVKIVALSDDKSPRERSASRAVDHVTAKIPTAATLATIVAGACL